jgi:hypothetical protein
MICSETNLKGKKTENMCACSVPFVLLVTTGEKEKKGGSQARSPVPCYFLWQHVNPRAASGGRAWRRRAALFLQLQNAFLAIPGLFLGLFVNN